MFELDISKQTKEEIPTETKAIKLLHSAEVLKSLYRPRIKRISERLIAEMEQDGGWMENPISAKEYQAEELNENEHMKLVKLSCTRLLDFLAYANNNLPQLEKIEFDSSLKIGFLEPIQIANLAKNIPPNIKHLYVNDQGFTHRFSCQDAIIAFFSNLPISLVTLQVSNMQNKLATAILKCLKAKDSIQHLILSDNKLFDHDKSVLSVLFAHIGKNFNLNTFEIVNEKVKFSIIDILLQYIRAKKIVFFGNINNNEYVANPIKRLPQMNQEIRDLELSEAIFKKAIEQDSPGFVKALFKLGVTVPASLNVEAQQTTVAANLTRSLLTFSTVGALCSAWLLAKNRRHAVPAIGKLSNSGDIIKLVSEMLNGYPRISPKH